MTAMAAIEPQNGGTTTTDTTTTDKDKINNDSLKTQWRSPKFSNPNIALSNHNNSGDILCEYPNIITRQEAEALVYSLDSGLLGKDWSLEGYDRQNRVQRYQRLPDDESNNKSSDDGSSTDGDLMEESFGWVFDRIASAASTINDGSGCLLKHRPYEVIVTEHTPSSCRSEVNVFEQFPLCSCRQNQQQTSTLEDNNNNSSTKCTCYLAQLTLINNSIQHTEKPQHRHLECWDIASPPEIHSGELTMEQNGVIVKTGESLWNWRCRIADVEEAAEDGSVPTEDSSDGNGVSNDVELNNKGKKKKKSWTRTKKLKALNKRSITVTFRGIHPSPIKDEGEDVVDEEALAKQQALANQPLSELLTIVVTTSPIRSNPSTEMLEHTFDTFQFAGHEFAYDCKKVIVCDGCRVLEEVNGDSATGNKGPPKIRIYANGKQNLRNGVATMDQSKNYTEFKAALHKICEEADNSSTPSPFRNTRVVELPERHGYGFALRHALRHCVDTPYVCVIQHDRNFMRIAPVKEVVKTIICNPNIKYVGMSMKSNLMYYDIFSGKYGKRAIDEFKTLILRPKELCIGGGMYGPNGESCRTMPAPCKKNRTKTMDTLRDAYKGSHQNLNHLDWMQSTKNEYEQGFHQLSLTPTLFWYDNTHIVETAHYRDFIFNPKYKMVARGGFVEDKLSPVITRNVERLGLKEGHAKFGCYLLDDHSGAYFTGHLDGGSYKTAHLYLKNDKRSHD